MSANGLGQRARPGTVSADGGGAGAALSSLVEWADAIVIGAGAGLSIADGDAHAGPVFEERFADFMEARGITDAYSGGFYPFPTPTHVLFRSSPTRTRAASTPSRPPRNGGRSGPG